MNRLLRTALVLAGACVLAEPSATAASADPAPAQPGSRLAGAVVQTRQDIQDALQELNALRQTIAGERKPLTSTLAELESAVRADRRETDRQQAARLLAETRQDALDAEVRALEEDMRFLHALLSEYRRSLETRLSLAEVQALRPALAEADAALADSGESSRLPQAASLLLDLAAQWNGRKLGGVTFAGAVLDRQGREVAGTFAVLGPAVYVAAADGPAAGIAVAQPGSTLPALIETPPAAGAPIRRLTEGEEVVVPVDFSLGGAAKVSAARRTLAEHLRAGGIVMIPLLAVGLLAAALIAWKTASLRRVQVPAPAAVEHLLELLRAGRLEEARDASQAFGEPMGSILGGGIEHRLADRELLEEILDERVLASMPALERHLGTLSVLGGVAPLLGLLGTVTGMIHTFQLVTVFGTGDARLLSSGISEALITTEVGLVIAIPVLLVHALLSRRVRSVLAGMEAAVIRFVNGLDPRGGAP